MKKTLIILFSLFILLTSCGRPWRTAEDITPENCGCTKLDWRYGAGDIEIQTSKVTCCLMDRWIQRTGYDCLRSKPCIIITDIDNCTDRYISTEMIRDIFENVAVNDGRFTVSVGDALDEQELDFLRSKILNAPKYAKVKKLKPGLATAPQFLGKVRITKAVTKDRWFNYETYRMTVTLYDIETQEIVDSDYDVLQKRIRACY